MVQTSKDGDGKSSYDVAEDGASEYSYYPSQVTTDYLDTETEMVDNEMNSDQIEQDQETYDPEAGYDSEAGYDAEDNTTEG